jgi:hypothetical protein
LTSNTSSAITQTTDSTFFFACTSKHNIKQPNISFRRPSGMLSETETFSKVHFQPRPLISRGVPLLPPLLDFGQHLVYLMDYSQVYQESPQTLLRSTVASSSIISTGLGTNHTSMEAANSLMVGMYAKQSWLWIHFCRHSVVGPEPASRVNAQPSQQHHHNSNLSK